VPRVKYAMDYRPKNRFSMSYASRKVVFPGVLTNASELLVLTHKITYNVNSTLRAPETCGISPLNSRNVFGEP
jgi:hypothetical protein